MKTETRIRRSAMSAEDGIAVVRRNTEEVQGRGNFEVFEEIFADSLARVEAKLSQVASESAAWRTLAESTDYEQISAARTA
jgi:hypothetical protein